MTFEKKLLKTSEIVLVYSNSLARHFSPMFHTKCLLPRLDRLVPVRSCLKYYYQCRLRFNHTYCWIEGYTTNNLNHERERPDYYQEKLFVEADPPHKRESSSRIHQHTAHKKGVHL